MLDGNARLSHPVKFPGIEINAIFVCLIIKEGKIKACNFISYSFIPTYLVIPPIFFLNEDQDYQWSM